MKSKKILPLIVLLFSVPLLFTACGKEDRPLEERLGNQEEQLESFEGVIEGVSKDVYQEGTHQLKTEEEGMVFIQSSSIDLNKYVGEKVIVQGKIKKGPGTAKPVLTVSKIEYVDDKEAIQEGLKLYENKDFGFKFEHPKTWLADESGTGVDFSFEETSVLKIAVFSDETNVNSFASSKEEAEGEEVTIAAQPSLRFVSGDTITFYIPNPPKKKIYQIEFAPSAELIESGDVEKLKAEFYALLESIQLIYLSKPQGQECGGEPVVMCPEDYFCELEDDSDFAEGVCVSIGSSTQADNCPFISTPSDCSEYRIRDYGQNGCPIAYECVDGENEHIGTDFIPDQGSEFEPENIDASSTSEVTGSYVNNKLGFSVSYPKSWYYVSFGPIDGTQGKIGFAEGEFEEVGDSIITMSMEKTERGKASKKIGDIYYNFDGPSALTAVMQEMAQSLKSAEIEE